MPTDEQRALWAAIRAHPLDDVPRLVYADWLQEHGDEVRAEFIRLQCAIARAPTDRKTQRKVLRALDHRERVLYMAHHVRWAGPLFRALVGPRPSVSPESWVRGTGVPFRRGFISGLRLDLDGVHRIMTAGADLEPTFDLLVAQGFPRYNPKKLAEVFAWEGVSGMSRLTFAGATDPCAAAVAASTAARLTHLEFTFGEITDAGAVAISEWPRGAGLVSLGLKACRIGDRGAAALADSPYLGAIAELNLEQNPIGQIGRRRLVSRFGGAVVLSREPV